MLADPDEVRLSRKDPRVLLFYRGSSPRWLCAVVRRENGTGFIVTAYPTDAIKAGETLSGRNNFGTLMRLGQYGKIASITLPKGNAVTYSYDSLGRLIQIKDAFGNSPGTSSMVVRLVTGNPGCRL